MQQLKGLATGIGSLPHKDADEAINLILKYIPKVPFWPQLPMRDFREGMVAQFSEGLPCIKAEPKGVKFGSKDREKELEKFYEHIIAADTDYFKISENFAQGLHKFYQKLELSNLKDSIEFIKCQITGPFTFAGSLNNEEGGALLYDEFFMQAVIKGLIMKALWQIKLFKKFGKEIIVFIDEPLLAGFGSAYMPLGREAVVKGLSEVSSAIKEEGALAGVHCCGNTDWSIFTETSAIDIISFDAFEFMDKLVIYAYELKKFLKRGGILCWGVVPTQLFSGQETPDLLVRKIKDGIYQFAQKGIPENLLAENILISPSCGLGTFSAEKAEKIFKLLFETAFSLKKYL